MDALDFLNPKTDSSSFAAACVDSRPLKKGMLHSTKLHNQR